jgi:hypothetical protein
MAAPSGALPSGQAAGSGFEPAGPKEQAIVTTRSKILAEHAVFLVP